MQPGAMFGADGAAVGVLPVNGAVVVVEGIGVDGPVHGVVVVDGPVQGVVLVVVVNGKVDAKTGQHPSEC